MFKLTFNYLRILLFSGIGAHALEVRETNSPIPNDGPNCHQAVRIFLFTENVVSNQTSVTY